MADEVEEAMEQFSDEAIARWGGHKPCCGCGYEDSECIYESGKALRVEVIRLRAEVDGLRGALKNIRVVITGKNGKVAPFYSGVRAVVDAALSTKQNQKVQRGQKTQK